MSEQCKCAKCAQLELLLEQALKQLGRAINHKEYSRRWWAERFERLKDLCKEHGIWDDAATIMANGNLLLDEQPTYAQLLSTACNARDLVTEQLTAAQARIAELEQCLQEIIAARYPNNIPDVHEVRKSIDAVLPKANALLAKEGK